MMQLKDEYRERWRQLQEGMATAGADGCLVSTVVNWFYLTGRVMSGFAYLPAEGEPWFFIKRPVNEQGEHIRYIRKPEDIPALIREVGIPLPETLLLEADELPYREYVRLEGIFHPKATGNATTLFHAARRIKTDYELTLFRLGGKAHTLAYQSIPDLFTPGMKETELQWEIERVMRRCGCMGLIRTFGTSMEIFMGSVLAGDNAEAPSPYDFALGGGGVDFSLPIGGNGTNIEKGMTVMVDIGGTVTPYITDMTRVFSYGRLPEEAYRAHQVSIDIQSVVSELAIPGAVCSELYDVAVRIASKEGLEDFFMGTKQKAQFIGHGIGLQLNEGPILSHRSKDILEKGMVFALEPKFVLPEIGAVGIENSFIVHEHGLEKITTAEEQILPFLET
ncbi:MAG: Xaa-Pro peptidase family protein [Tannerellaceae bacterium]|jgi:Xaa-Pro aminopeptidase|nr:Xaa-Pro peptidase family protein [Tannerellaceae bacterium]